MKTLENFKNKIFVAIMAVSAFAAPAVSHADDCCWDYDCPSVCDWEWYLGAQYLYWKPCVNDLDYAALSAGSGGLIDGDELDIKRVCPDWESGYRIYLGVSSTDGYGLFGSFTQLKASASDSITSADNAVFPVKIHPLMSQFITGLSGDQVGFNAAESYWDSNYREWFVGVNYQMEINSCNHLTPYFGVAGLHYDDSLRSNFLIDIDGEEIPDLASLVSDYSVDYTGVGLRLGSYYMTTICDCFGFYANMNGSLLVGDYDSCSIFGFDAILEEEEVDFFKFNDDGCCSFISGCQLGLGFTYDTCICNVDLIFKIGYEFNAWFNLPDYRYFGEGVTEFTGFINDEEETEVVFSNLGVSSQSTSRTVAYHGLTAGIALKF